MEIASLSSKGIEKTPSQTKTERSSEKPEQSRPQETLAEDDAAVVRVSPDLVSEDVKTEDSEKADLATLAQDTNEDKELTALPSQTTPLANMDNRNNVPGEADNMDELLGNLEDEGSLGPIAGSAANSAASESLAGFSAKGPGAKVDISTPDISPKTALSEQKGESEQPAKEPESVNVVA